eukprot:Lankesteria_metandrocarpae@DN5177_c5_g1_i2.p1
MSFESTHHHQHRSSTNGVLVDRDRVLHETLTRECVKWFHDIGLSPVFLSAPFKNETKANSGLFSFLLHSVLRNDSYVYSACNPFRQHDFVDPGVNPTADHKNNSSKSLNSLDTSIIPGTTAPASDSHASTCGTRAPHHATPSNAVADVPTPRHAQHHHQPVDLIDQGLAVDQVNPHTNTTATVAAGEEGLVNHVVNEDGADEYEHGDSPDVCTETVSATAMIPPVQTYHSISHSSKNSDMHQLFAERSEMPAVVGPSSADTIPGSVAYCIKAPTTKAENYIRLPPDFVNLVKQQNSKKFSDRPRLHTRLRSVNHPTTSVMDASFQRLYHTLKDFWDKNIEGHAVLLVRSSDFRIVAGVLVELLETSEAYVHSIFGPRDLSILDERRATSCDGPAFSWPRDLHERLMLSLILMTSFVTFEKQRTCQVEKGFSLSAGQSPQVASQEENAQSNGTTTTSVEHAAAKCDELLNRAIKLLLWDKDTCYMPKAVWRLMTDVLLSSHHVEPHDSTGHPIGCTHHDTVLQPSATSVHNSNSSSSSKASAVVGTDCSAVSKQGDTFRTPSPVNTSHTYADRDPTDMHHGDDSSTTAHED